MVSRAVLFGIDAKERRISFVMAGIESALVLFLLYSVVFNFHKTTTLTEALSKAKTCTRPYVLAKSNTICQYVQANSRSEQYLITGLIALCAVALLMFTIRRSRPGAVFVLMFTGLAYVQFSSIIGLVFIASGGWILYRGWSLHKYGVVGFGAVSAVKQDRLAARKEGRADPHPAPPPEPVTPRASRRAAPPDDAVTLARKAAEPSKRYTPKKPPRARTR